MTEMETMEQNMIAWQLIEMGREPPEETDWDYCRDFLKKEAEKGNARTQLRYGDLLLTKEKDCMKAAQWYKKAGEQGNSEAKKALLKCKPLIVLDAINSAMSLVQSDDPKTRIKGFARMEKLAEMDAETALPEVTDIYISLEVFRHAREFLNRMAAVDKKHAEAVKSLLPKMEAAASAAEENNKDGCEIENDQE